MLYLIPLMRWAAALLLLVLLSSGCATPERAADLPAAWIWDQNQALITAADGARHAWNGWVLHDGAFEAKDSVCRIVFWRQARKLEKLAITYTLTGLPVPLQVNVKKKPLLINPSPQMHTVIIDVPLKKGVNFLKFRKQPKDKLRIQSLIVGPAPPPRRGQLEPGESLTAFFLPGRGRIELAGKGELILETSRPGASGLETQTHRAWTGIFKRRIAQNLDFDHPGTLTIRAAAGAFTVSRYTFQEKPIPPSPEPRRLLHGDPPVFILLMDACQARHLRLYGYSRPTSRNLERLASDAVVYENAYANASYTRSSVRSLFSGQYPERSGAGNLTRVGDDRRIVIPEFLKIKGYRTAIFTSAVTISPTFGFTRGVDDYFPFYGELEKWKERRIDFNRFALWLKRTGPLFAYFHFIEPHLPIVAPPPYLDVFKSAPGPPRRQRLINQTNHTAARRRFFTPDEIQDVRDDYDSTIAYVDGQIGKALEEIRRAGLYDKSLIIVLSDHGEAMYEHGVWGHSINVFDETIHVPLVIKFPSNLNLVGRVRRLVQITDIFPTLAALFGQQLNLPGTSLLEEPPSDDIDDTLAVSQSIAEAGLFGLRWRNWQAVIDLKTGRQQLYDLAADPAKDVADSFQPLNAYFMGRLLDWLKNLSDNETEDAAIDMKKLTPTEIENLKTLGYL